MGEMVDEPLVLGAKVRPAALLAVHIDHLILAEPLGPDGIPTFR